MRMKNYSHDNYEIEFYRIPSTNNSRVDHFAPSIQSLKAAQDIVRRYEKRRRAATKLNRQIRGTAPLRSRAVKPAESDNVIAFRGPVWTRPSLRLVYSRHVSPPHDSPSQAPPARRGSLQREARTHSRYIWSAAPSPLEALRAASCDDLDSSLVQHVVVMAVQGLAVVLGLGGLLALLTLL